MANLLNSALTLMKNEFCRKLVLAKGTCIHASCRLDPRGTFSLTLDNNSGQSIFALAISIKQMMSAISLRNLSGKRWLVPFTSGFIVIISLPRLGLQVIQKSFLNRFNSAYIHRILRIPHLRSKLENTTNIRTIKNFNCSSLLKLAEDLMTNPRALDAFFLMYLVNVLII